MDWGIEMSDEYSVGNRFLDGKLSGEGYKQKMEYMRQQQANDAYRKSSISDRQCPFGPPDRPDLRTTRFEDEGELWHRWIWEPIEQRWFHRSTSTAAEREVAQREHEAYMREHPITDREWEQINRTAREIDRDA